MTKLPSLFRTTLSIGVIATAAVAGVAHADARGDVAKYNPKTKTYCISEVLTGSLIPQRICATRQEWLDSGATIISLSAKQTAA